MKLFQLILILMLPAISICQTKKDNIKITGKINGKIPETIEYTLPINGIEYFGFTNSIQPDSAGNFEIQLHSDKTCFIDLSNNYKSFGTLIAEPGMNYKVDINTENAENKFRVESSNQKGQELYNQLSNRSMIVGGHFELETRNYQKDSIVYNINQKLNQSYQTEIIGFKKLLKEKKISKNFYDLIESDRDYFYKGAQGSLAFINFLNSERNKNTLTEVEYSELWASVFQSNPITDPKLLSSPWFYFYIENYLRYKELILEKVTTSALSEIGKKGLIHTHNIETAKKYLTGFQLEYFIAAYIYYNAINQNYEKELLTLFDQFKKEYPSSRFISFLEPVIIPVINFHNKQKESLNEKIKFAENTADFTLLKDVLKDLKGKQYYVDVWATWCGPCKEEFKYNAKLYELLKSKNITMVYISIDKDFKEKQWKEMAHFYNLEGYHIRVNEKLDADLRILNGNSSLAIPWHFLADENGNIINKRMSGPSKIENLKIELIKN
ncbi:TlpA family protein disulfide reductase [Flavobacterium sp. 17A]|uniref:TlpA family protein disulfide reductase n=1 Tax=Flavobacterium potami TaxID=2872310 RepID=A0A9X1H8R5_9FLAO|nr:TlpA disulfide reductase family protein [Flavobacterium potami]MBZ4034788.1 TlpA family protein disulfide reductase [Flavobacterium potami]